MSASVRRWLTAVTAALIPALFLALPAAAQSLGGSPVSCDPADPAPGETTTCTAEGLEPSSAFTWRAEFADGSAPSGDGTADAEGVGTFEVAVPDSEEAEGDYTVTVNGTGEDGEPYEEQHEGTVGGGGPLDGLGVPESPSEEPSEEPSEGEGSEEPAPGGGDDDTFGAPDGGEDQVDPVPSGAVAAGMGGTSTDPAPARALAVVLLAAASIGHVVARRQLAEVGVAER